LNHEGAKNAKKRKRANDHLLSSVFLRVLRAFVVQYSVKEHYGIHA